MADILTTNAIIQMAITGGTGLLGIGMGIGIFKSTINQFKARLEKVELRQSKIRGEDNGGIPIFMTRSTCNEERAKCAAAGESRMSGVSSNMDKHTVSIQSLENFARWWMQKQGLNISEINEVLRNK